MTQTRMHRAEGGSADGGLRARAYASLSLKPVAHTHPSTLHTKTPQSKHIHARALCAERGAGGGSTELKAAAETNHTRTHTPQKNTSTHTHNGALCAPTL
eukprot:1050938-Rhodomonas_salina.1